MTLRTWAPLETTNCICSFCISILTYSINNSSRLVTRFGRADLIVLFSLLQSVLVHPAQHSSQSPYFCVLGQKNADIKCRTRERGKRSAQNTDAERTSTSVHSYAVLCGRHARTVTAISHICHGVVRDFFAEFGTTSCSLRAICSPGLVQ